MREGEAIADSERGPCRHRPGEATRVLALTQHPVGRFKAPFFQALGYSSENWRQLEVDLRTQHLSQDVRLEGQTPYGRKYSIHATLVGPSGSSADMVSVWIVRTGDELPRFVTAYREVSR